MGKPENKPKPNQVKPGSLPGQEVPPRVNPEKRKSEEPVQTGQFAVIPIEKWNDLTNRLMDILTARQYNDAIKPLLPIQVFNLPVKPE